MLPYGFLKFAKFLLNSEVPGNISLLLCVYWEGFLVGLIRLSLAFIRGHKGSLQILSKRKTFTSSSEMTYFFGRDP